jgi:hypothetical protein
LTQFVSNPFAVLGKSDPPDSPELENVPAVPALPSVATAAPVAQTPVPSNPNPKEVAVSSFWSKIKSFFHGLGMDLGAVFTELPKLITLTEDAENVATNALPEVMTLVQDSGVLVAATVKDGGAFLASFAELSAAIAAAIAAKAVNITADAAVVTAFENFCSLFNEANVSDILAAWAQITTDVKTLDTTMIAALQKMEADAKASSPAA